MTTAISLKLKKAGVVIVNYNSAELAVEAALSALGAASLQQQTQVVIVDNASPDGSFLKIKEMLTEYTAASAYPELPGVVYHDVREVKAVCGKYCNTEISFEDAVAARQAHILLISADRNAGFGAGCNIGVQALKKFDTDMFIMLNPDAVMTRKTIHAFAVALDVDAELGLAGASLLETDTPHYAQLFGGASFIPFTLLGRNIGAGKLLRHAPPQESVDLELSYPHGAAMACRLDYIEYAGLLDERYFLYYEEADWVAKGRSRYRPGWVKDAVVYHHRGAVTGSYLSEGARSTLADYHMARSRMIYARKWKPWLLPFLMLLGTLQTLRRFLRGQRQQAYALLAGTFGRELPGG